MEDQNEPVQILYENSEFRVLVKSSRYHSVEGPNPKNPSVEAWLKKNFAESKNLPQGGLLHRLDYLTSGIMLAAKTPQSFESLLKEVRESAQKTYLAWVHGKPAASSFEFYFFSRYEGSKKVTVSLKGKKSELGRCQWKISATQEKRSLLEVGLLGPGKRHQIRAGLAKLGHPIVGDPLYSMPEESGFFGLHAWRLKLGESQFEAPIPAAWKIFIAGH